MRRALNNPAAQWAAGLTLILAYDAWLTTHHYPSLSQTARTHPHITAAALTLLTAHFYRPPRLARYDPLTIIGAHLAH